MTAPTRPPPFAFLLLTALAVACTAVETPPGADVKPALDAITADGILQHIKTLASDGFEGRGPGTAGEDSTVNYLQAQFQALGLKPGNPDGSWVQNVSLVGFTSKAQGTIKTRGTSIALKPLVDWVGVSRRMVTDVKVDNSDVVFVGYGVVAPEYGWDDYKDVDVKGKTIVMLINDPAIPSPTDATQLDSAMFKGRAMTYYGRWTYKYEIASQKGAAAVLIVHEEGPAGYPFSVVVGSWGRENFDIKPTDGNASRVAVESWVTWDKAAELFTASGQDLAALKQAALRKDFKPVSLGAQATFHVTNTVRDVQSRNVIARLEGGDASLRDEYVLYSAHWDHLGKDTTLKGDQIFNGALDNASGTASLLALAKAFTALATPPARSVLFLAVTAEEQGLLGAKYYAEHPLYPLTKTLADINIDGINQWGKTKDITVVGLGNSSLEDDLAGALAANGRTIKADPEPQKGFFYRSDQFEFAKRGVPCLYTDPGIEFIGKPPEYGQQKRDAYTAKDYHNVSDEVKPDWDLSGGVEDVQALFRVGYGVAQTDKWPEWKAGTEFKARREASLAGDQPKPRS